VCLALALDRPADRAMGKVALPWGAQVEELPCSSSSRTSVAHRPAFWPSFQLQFSLCSRDGCSLVDYVLGISVDLAVGRKHLFNECTALNDAEQQDRATR